MNEKELRKIIEDYELDETIEVETNLDADFEWDDVDNDLHFQVINIQMVGLTKEIILDILDNDGNAETFFWSGRVVQEKKYSEKELIKVDEPAYGGESNTDGIPESGSLYVDKELLLS